MKTIRAGAVWLPGRLERDRTIVLDEAGKIVELRSPRPADGPPLEGLVLPGLINGHVHLELSWMEGRVRSTQQGLVNWLERQLHFRTQAPSAAEQLALARAHAEKMAAWGTAGVFDISNSDATGELLLGAGLSGIVQHELLTMDRTRLPSVMKQVAEPRADWLGEQGVVLRRPGPHALYSTAPQLLRASASAESRLPFSIHISEAEEELEFIAEGRGPLAEFMDALGVEWDWWEAPGLTPVAYLDALGLLGPRCLLVHGVELDDADVDLIVEQGASLCLCPRSNRWITGEIPEVRRLLDAQVPLCVGTDSLASNSSLDLFEELVELGRSFPEVGMEPWLKAVTDTGGGVLGVDGLGRVEEGASPGLLWLPEVAHVEALREGAPRRREWLASPRGSYDR
jgi:aminodeoxyfutalosine deaminase